MVADPIIPMRKKTIQKSKNPLTLRPIRPELFWDVDPKTIDMKKHARYIIERILEYGTVKEVQWLAHRFRTHNIQRVMALPRVQLSKKSKGLWQNVFQSK